jgi:[ribosomal protein S5]-alanine N-acetyltransferase
MLRMASSAWQQPALDIRAIAIEEPPVATDWRTRAPILHGRAVTVRELRLTDAPSLLAMLTTEEVARFISPPPTTVEGFERFITWCHGERMAGRAICFGIVPEGSEHAIGLIQFRSLDYDFSIAEWGFAIGRPFWGTGLFMEAACCALRIAFTTLQTRRIEARVCVENGRGNGVLAKLGAVQEGRFHESFMRDGRSHDQYLWSISRPESGYQAKAVWGSSIH